MKLIVITLDLLTGVEEMDNQHRKIAEYVNHMYDLTLEGKLKDVALFYRGAFMPFAKYHISSENEFLLSTGYPEYEYHKRLHDVLLNIFQKMDGYMAEYITDKERLKRALYFLTAWISDHIEKVDKKYGEFYKTMHSYK